jgi:hypothetical protein
MQEKDIATAVADAAQAWSVRELLPHIWMLAISLLGGVASFARKVKAGVARWLNISEFIGELLISAFSGLLTYWICRRGNLDQYLTAAAVGMSGHMGARALLLIEQLAVRRVEKISGTTIDHPKE